MKGKDTHQKTVKFGNEGTRLLGDDRVSPPSKRLVALPKYPETLAR